MENLKPPVYQCSDIHKEVVAFQKQWQEKYSLRNSEDVNIHLCQYSDIFSTSKGNPLFEQIEETGCLEWISWLNYCYFVKVSRLKNIYFHI